MTLQTPPYRPATATTELHRALNDLSIYTEMGVVDVRDTPIVIGSHAGCDVRVDSLLVSGRHAEIYAVGDTLWLRDLDSEDGTYLNGEFVEVAPLDVPSELRLGERGPLLRLAPSA